MNYDDLKKYIRIHKQGGASIDECKYFVEALCKSNGNIPLQDALIQIELVYYSKVAGETAVQKMTRILPEMHGWFDLPKLYNQMEIRGETDKTAIRVALGRLVDSGYVQRHHQIDGNYRRIDGQAPIIDWQSADLSKTVDIHFPFPEIDNLINIYPRSIIVVAGSPDAGKTAFMLNIVKLNQHQLPITYFSSEMGPEELKSRLTKFDGVEWIAPFRDKSSNFADVIDPNQVSIIDYLEITSEFWLVGQEIKAIYDKLNKGIVILAIQKDPDSPLGRGKSFGLEKARLYLSLNKNSIKVMKAKNWKNETLNPNGKAWKFKLYKGCVFRDIQEEPQR